MLGFGGTILNNQLCVTMTSIIQLTMVDGTRLLPPLTNPLATRKGFDVEE